MNDEEKRLTVTREAPTRGSVKDYQDWLVEQLRAGVDGYFTGACISDVAWAERVIRAESEAEKWKAKAEKMSRGGAKPPTPPEVGQRVVEYWYHELGTVIAVRQSKHKNRFGKWDARIHWDRVRDERYKPPRYVHDRVTWVKWTKSYLVLKPGDEGFDPAQSGEPS